MLDSIFHIRLLTSLPLHIRHFILTTSAERILVIDNVSRACLLYLAGSWARLGGLECINRRRITSGGAACNCRYEQHAEDDLIHQVSSSVHNDPTIPAHSSAYSSVPAHCAMPAVQSSAY